MDAFGRVAAVILAAILVFLLPIKYVAVNSNAALHMQVHNETVKFADEIMMQGYLTKDMYNTYVNELDRTGELYDIEIIHGKPTEGYKTGSIIKTSRMNSKSKKTTNLSTNSVRLMSSNTHTYDICAGISKSTACNTIVTTKSKTIPVSLTVIPSSYTVFNGSEPTYTVKVNYIDNTIKTITDGYTKTGFTLGAGAKIVTFTYTENDTTVSASVEIIVKRNQKKCMNGHIYELDDYDNDKGCPVCGTILKAYLLPLNT
jgi:hypothetical protein